MNCRENSYDRYIDSLAPPVEKLSSKLEKSFVDLVIWLGKMQRFLGLWHDSDTVFAIIMLRENEGCSSEIEVIPIQILPRKS